MYFFEDRYGIELDDEDLTVERFETIAAMESLILSKVAGASAPPGGRSPG